MPILPPMPCNVRPARATDAAIRGRSRTRGDKRGQLRETHRWRPRPILTFVEPRGRRECSSAPGQFKGANAEGKKKEEGERGGQPPLAA